MFAFTGWRHTKPCQLSHIWVFLRDNWGWSRTQQVCFHTRKLHSHSLSIKDAQFFNQWFWTHFLGFCLSITASMQCIIICNFLLHLLQDLKCVVLQETPPLQVNFAPGPFFHYRLFKKKKKILCGKPRYMLSSLHLSKCHMEIVKKFLKRNMMYIKYSMYKASHKVLWVTRSFFCV